MILSRLPNALVNGEFTSTSRKLNQSDFEYFMSVLESHAPNQTIPSYSRHYWKNAFDNELIRMRRKVEWFTKQLQDASILTCTIEAVLIRHTNGEVKSLDEIKDHVDMGKLINMLRVKAKQHQFELKE